MFTGLVTHVGTIRSTRATPTGLVVEVAADLGPLALGESIAVDGVCLTVTRASGAGFLADVSTETSSRTVLGERRVGDRVHLERALRLGDRLGGHLVSGHVDGIGELVAVEPIGDSRKVRIKVPAALAPFLAAKGSITIDGVSLTINRAAGDELELMLVPHTLGHTTLGEKWPGARCNVEVDVLAKYVASLLGRPGVDGSLAETSAVSLDLLGRAGYL